MSTASPLPPSAPTPRPARVTLGVTGTDTGVGKTLVAAALVASLRETGLRVAPMKPVETGSGTDAELLRHAAGDAHPLGLVRPYHFAAPVAPLVAARRARDAIDPGVLDRAFAALAATSDAVVVEGAGGLRVPFTESLDAAALFKRWSLDLVIVAANRLGAINHTLLTVDSALAHGLPVKAIVLNTVTPDPQGTAEHTNQAVLEELLPEIPVVVFPYAQPPHATATLAALARALAATLGHPA